MPILRRLLIKCLYIWCLVPTWVISEIYENTVLYHLYNVREKMQNSIYKNIKNELFEQKRKEPPCFCPHCRNIFDNIKLYEVIEDNQFICNNCGLSKIFTHNTFKSEQKNGQNYKINGINDKSKINEFIYKKVTYLLNEGFSLKKISEITHFSETRILSVIKTKKSKNESNLYSIEIFFRDYLKVDDILLSQKLKNRELNNNEKIKLIDEMLKIGCSFDFISKLIEVSKRIINKCKKNLSRIDLERILKMKKKYQITYNINSHSKGFNILIIDLSLPK